MRDGFRIGAIIGFIVAKIIKIFVLAVKSIISIFIKKDSNDNNYTGGDY